MLENFYTTKMSGNKKALQKRFTRIRSHQSRAAKITAAAMAVVLVTGGVLANIVMAGVLNEGKNIIINGKEYDIRPILVENQRYLHTDSYYLPLRAVFEALGCCVSYNVDRSSIPEVWAVRDNTAEFPQYKDWHLNLVKDDITAQIYGATTGKNKNMPVIEIESANGSKWYCQIGSEYYTNAWAPPVITIDGTAYIPMRAIAYYLIPDGEDKGASILWDEVAHDTYFMGRLSWDEAAGIITIDTNAEAGVAAYIKAYEQLQDMTDMGITQRMESRKYLVCTVENFKDENTETVIAMDKATGKIAILDNYDKSTAHKLRLSFKNAETFVLSRIVPYEDRMEELASFDLSSAEYRNIFE